MQANRSSATTQRAPASAGARRAAPCAGLRASPIARRRGFTLVELLIVISIIAVLLLLTLQVVGALITQARAARTRATISKVQRLLNSRMEQFHRWYSNNDDSTKARLRATFEYTSLPTSLSDETRLVLTRKRLFRKYFPQSVILSEIPDQTLTPAQTLQPAIVTAIQAGTAVDSAEILYDFLTQSTVLGETPTGADAFDTVEVQDTDNDGLPELCDGWGRPLRFYRWPTRMLRWNLADPPVSPYPAPDLTHARSLMSTVPSLNDLARDPGDALNQMGRDFANNGWNPERSGLPAPFDSTESFHTPLTWHTPLIVSAGPDGLFGMHAPDDVTNLGTLANIDTSSPVASDAVTDNITNLNVRAGGS